MRKSNKPWREFEPGEVEAARELYMRYGPNARSRIVREMRQNGWLQFYLKDLDGRPERDFPGLPELQGWHAEWLAANPPPPEPEPEPESIPEGAHAELPSANETESVDAADLPSWLKATAPHLTWNWKFQKMIYKALDEITAGRRRRLMLFLPPRHGKSELVTIRYAAWRLLSDAGLRIVIASYNQRLANRFSRRIRAIYSGSPSTLEADGPDEPELAVRAADEWETRGGGGVKAVGVGAGITGFGGDLIIIDDPVKGRAEAESKNQRDRVWEWYTDDVITRLEPNGAVILIQTRWHEDDLAGRLLSQVQGLKSNVQSPKRGELTVLKLPALAEEDDPLRRKAGQALCHARFPRRKLLEIKAQMGSYSFAALYQQRPVPAGGALFKREWFSRVVDSPPPGLRWFRGYDLAVSTKTSADYTASFRCALDKRTGDLYIADGFRARLEFPDQRKYIVGRIRDERDTEHGIELALHGEAFIQELWREERLSRHAFRGVRVTTDKFTRALAWANRAEAGKIVLVRGHWIDQFLDEVTHFPGRAHDDQVDAVSLAVQMMETRRYKTRAF